MKKNPNSPIVIKVDNDTNIIIPPENRVNLEYSRHFFEKHGLFEWIDEFELGTAGYRDTMNMENFFSTEAPLNIHTIFIIAVAMSRIYNRKGYHSIHLGGEVRKYTSQIIQFVSRIFAQHGISVHLHADKETTPIWASSFGVFYNELDGGGNITASHSQNFKQGFKPIDEKGMQLLDMAEEIEDEVRRIGEEAKGGALCISLSPLSSPIIRKDFHYIVPYTEYLKDIIPEEGFRIIREAQEAGMRVGVSTVGGSMHENSVPIFERLGISTGPEGMIQYMHSEKRDDFHRVGEFDGENFGCDPTKPIIYRNIGLKEKLLADVIDFGFIWDTDGDRYNIVSIADVSRANESEKAGLEVERVTGSEKCVVYFKPNQIYFLDAALKLEMMAKSGELFRYDLVIGTTYPTSKSIGELAEVFNTRYAKEFLENGTKIRVFQTPVGFKYFGKMVAEIEDSLQRGGEVVLHDVTGKSVSLGNKPRVLIMAEESGGAAMGGTDWAISKNGNRRSLALKEKDGMQIALMNLSIMGKLFLERRSLAELYTEKIETYKITHRHYDRIDKKLFDEALTGETREKAREIGNQVKKHMVATFRAISKEDVTAQSARKKLQKMVGDRVRIPPIKRVSWVGDGTYIDFGDLWFELRASGTDAVLRFYIEGRAKEALDALNSAFVDIADAKLEELSATV